MFYIYSNLALTYISDIHQWHDANIRQSLFSDLCRIFKIICRPLRKE